MMLRLAFVALLTLSPAAAADEGDAGRGGAAVTRQVPAGSEDFPRIVFRRVERHGEHGARTETTLVAPRGARLELESFGGDIRVTGWDRKTVQLVADHESGTRVLITVQPAAVVVRARRELAIPVAEEGRHARKRTVAVPARVDYRLSVPRGMSLRLSGLDTQILVDDVQGDVSAETVSGPVAVRGGRGTIRVGAFDGGVEVVGARGSVEASSMSQDVILRDVEGGEVRAETVKGNLELARVLSEVVRASTVTGNLRYEGSILPGGEYRFASHSGDVVVVLPQRPDASVTVGTWRGSFQSSFPVPARPHRERQIEFLLGDGRAELEVESFSGAIRLLRAGEEPAPAPAEKKR